MCSEHSGCYNLYQTSESSGITEKSFDELENSKQIPENNAIKCPSSGLDVESVSECQPTNRIVEWLADLARCKSNFEIQEHAIARTQADNAAADEQHRSDFEKEVSYSINLFVSAQCCLESDYMELLERSRFCKKMIKRLPMLKEAQVYYVFLTAVLQSSEQSRRNSPDHIVERICHLAEQELGRQGDLSSLTTHPSPFLQQSIDEFDRRLGSEFNNAFGCSIQQFCSGRFNNDSRSRFNQFAECMIDHYEDARDLLQEESYRYCAFLQRLIPLSRTFEGSRLYPKFGTDYFYKAVCNFDSTSEDRLKTIMHTHPALSAKLQQSLKADTL